MDMLERPDWIVEKVWEVNQVFFEVYSRIYDIIKLADGSSVFGAFRLWGPGKVAKVQCDTSAMFSPAMFEKFVLPALARC
jgi:5-methyltetrahydrofolate--homocysteine methyltransferase